MKVVLWIVQVLLAGLFLFAGILKLVLPIEEMTGPIAFPGWFLRFIGAMEVLGALGLLLPGILRIRQSLTPMAAAGLVVIMIGAVITCLVGGLIGQAIVSLVVGILAASVVYGRRQLLAR